MKPKVFIAIPTGAIKDYAVLYMLAAIQNIDYPQESLTVNIAITNRNEPADIKFTKRLQHLIEYSNIKFQVNITEVTPTTDEKERWGQYYAVICNLHELRKQFLDSDSEYFWVLGGDNPPPRYCLNRLLTIGADVSSALILQRPNRAREFDKPDMPYRVDPHPMFWMYLWSMNDVQKRHDLEPELKEALRACWINLPLLHLIKTDKKLIVHNVSFGSGCSLVKREVMEHLGYYLGEAAYCSEDLQFMQWVHTLGFKTALDTGLHCGHFDPNGALY